MNTETKKKGKVWSASNLTRMAMMTALVGVSSYIMIPLPFSSASITAQTLAVNLIGMLLTPIQTLIVMSVWILLGLAGVPVFSGGTAGPGKLLGPSGGYIWGFLAAAIVISLFCRKVRDIRYQLLFLIFGGIPLIYLFGSIQMKLVMGLSWEAVLMQSVLPFIPLDIIKCFASAALAKALRRAVR